MGDWAPGMDLDGVALKNKGWRTKQMHQIPLRQCLGGFALRQGQQHCRGIPVQQHCRGIRARLRGCCCVVRIKASPDKWLRMRLEDISGRFARTGAWVVGWEAFVAGGGLVFNVFLFNCLVSERVAEPNIVGWWMAGTNQPSVTCKMCAAFPAQT